MAKSKRRLCSKRPRCRSPEPYSSYVALSPVVLSMREKEPMGIKW